MATAEVNSIREAGETPQPLLSVRDLAVVAETCQRALVMYGGKIQESGTVQQIYDEPKHPYTKGLLTLGRRAMRPLRANIQIVFQNPYASLNPRMTVREIIERPLKIHTRKTAAQRREVVQSLLERVGLQPDYAARYPHEFSGGQRQRIGIGRALAVNPQLIIADEPVSALDVSVHSQVINLLQDLQNEFQLTYSFVAHDLSVVHHISGRIAVMYLGDLIEIGDAEIVYHTPRLVPIRWWSTGRGTATCTAPCSMSSRWGNEPAS